MSLIALIIILALVGAIVWAVVTYIPMTDGFKKLIIAVAIIVSLIYVLTVMGVMPDVNAIRVGSVR